MRSLLLISALGGILTIGCAHKSEKPDQTTAPAKAADSVKTVEKKVESTGKSKMEHTTKAQPEAEAGTGPGKSECSVRGDERVIDVRSKDKGCELAYTKGGTENVIASSPNGTAYCEKAAEKLKEKLKGAGFTCK